MHGGVVVATRRLPSTAPGLLNAEAENQRISQISQRLFRGKGAVGHFIEDEKQLGSVLASYFKPDVVLSPSPPEIEFIHRHLSSGDLYFIANTGNQAHGLQAKFRQSAKYAESWDPFTGRTFPLENTKIEISLQPYESRLIFFTNSPIRPAAPRRSGTASKVVDLSADWNLTFASQQQTFHMTELHSWSEEDRFKYYSGEVAYEKRIDLPSDLKPGTSLVLDFGEGTPLPKPDPLPMFNLQASLESPIREAADVYINGQHAGVVWHPPYTLDVSTLLRAGKNQLRIVVGNTAINSLAGQSLPDYRLLNDRYGERFVPQGMNDLKPLPSGLLGGLRLRMSQ
jgi:alpha-L-rhamnosidase